MQPCHVFLEVFLGVNEGDKKEHTMCKKNFLCIAFDIACFWILDNPVSLQLAASK